MKHNRVYLYTLTAASLLVMGCAPAVSPQPAEPKTAAETPDLRDPAASPDTEVPPQETAAAEADEAVKKRAAAAKRPPSAEPDYQLNPRDCDVLGHAYRKSWLNDELKRRAKGGDKKRLSQLPAPLRAQLERAADAGRDQWLGQCLSIAGSAMPRKNLVCATKARNMDRFNACWEGRAK